MIVRVWYLLSSYTVPVMTISNNFFVLSIFFLGFFVRVLRGLDHRSSCTRIFVEDYILYYTSIARACVASFVSRSGSFDTYYTTSSTAAMVGVGESFSLPFFFSDSLVVIHKRESERRREGSWHRLRLRLFYSLAINNSGGGVCVVFDDQSTQQASNPRYSTRFWTRRTLLLRLYCGRRFPSRFSVPI